MKYRKKPIVIEAIQWKLKNKAEIDKFVGYKLQKSCENVTKDGLCIVTKEGTMVAIPNDWIIKGIKNEFYPCKPDIFKETYEKVE